MEKEILRRIDLLTADIVDAQERIKEASTVSEEVVAKMELHAMLRTKRVLTEILNCK